MEATLWVTCECGDTFTMYQRTVLEGAQGYCANLKRKATVSTGDLEPEIAALYEVDDYLLIDSDGEIQAVSGNSDFWAGDDECSVDEASDEYTIVKVVSVSDTDGGTVIFILYNAGSN